MRRVLGFRGTSLQLTHIMFDYEAGRLEVRASLVDEEAEPPLVVAETTCTSWGDKTKRILLDLVKQMEKDVCNQLGKGSRGPDQGGILEALGDVDESGDSISSEDT